MFQASYLRASEASEIPTKLPINPYKAQRSWPPDFDKLHPKYQFRLERKYRRRSKLKWARPRWIKAVNIAQWGTIAAVLGYGVLYMDWGREETPFQGIRTWFHKQTNSIWTEPMTPPPKPGIGNTKTNTT